MSLGGVKRAFTPRGLFYNFLPIPLNVARHLSTAPVIHKLIELLLFILSAAHNNDNS